MPSITRTTRTALSVLLAVAASWGVRCDLVSRPESSRCLDLAKLDQTTLVVPSSTTRIPTDALVLCGRPASVPDPTDIVYVVDQTTSMKPTALFVSGTDTSGWFECNQNNNPRTPAIAYKPGTLDFHGSSVRIIAPDTPFETVKSVCSVAGDPFSAREKAIQTALRTQAEKAPNSNAATINFARTILSSQTSTTSLADPSGLATLLASVPNTNSSGTYYENPLAWSRILLYGGHSGAKSIPASPNAKKAVIFLSDGRPLSDKWADGLKASATVAYGNSNWTTDSSAIPPVYGIFLGVDQVEGSVLEDLSKRTGGHYYQIPPTQPDSLGRVIQQILGELIPAVQPDGMTVVNQTNGQRSVAVKTTVDGNSYRMQLDSLVGLQPGSNQIVLSTLQNGSPVSARLNIVVSDEPGGASELDALLTTRCDAASSLTVRPDKSGLAWADTPDANLLLTLNTAPDQLVTLSILGSTRLAGDRETNSINVTAEQANGKLTAFSSSIPWQLPTTQGVVPGDRVLRSGVGWDTALFTFAMPRDARDTASARIALRHPPESPDSVVYLDTDGDGALDRVVAHLKLAWKTGMELQLPWPDAGTLLDWSAAKLSLSGDSLVATFDFGPRSPDATTPREKLVARWRAGSIWEWHDVPVVEHIAPVPLRARLVRGSGQDTLRIAPSEGLSGTLADAEELAARLAGGSNRNLSPTGAAIDAATGELVLRFPGESVASLLVPGDSVRFLPGIADKDGNRASGKGKAVVVEGTDPLPRDAAILDTDADGRADRIVVRLIAPLAVTDSFGFRWPDPAGILQERRLAAKSAVVDSNGLRLTFDVAPFAYGATSCPAEGCRNLSWMSSARFGTDVRATFPLRDAVDPIPLRARYSYAASASDPDTLAVAFSEPLVDGSDAPWIAVGRPSRDSLGRTIVNRRDPLRRDASNFVFLVDSTDLVQVGDSLRLAMDGALSDEAGNRPGRLAHWALVDWGTPPPLLRVSVPHPVVHAQETDAPAGEPALTVAVQDPRTGTYSVPGGTVPEGIETRFGGTIVRLTRIPKHLGLYIYDNMGVAVLSTDLSNLSDLDAAGLLRKNHRGEVVVWLAWNGKDTRGKPVASGVYTLRVWGRFEVDGDLRVLNKTLKEGIYRQRPLFY